MIRSFFRADEMDRQERLAAEAGRKWLEEPPSWLAHAKSVARFPSEPEANYQQRRKIIQALQQADSERLMAEGRDSYREQKALHMIDMLHRQLEQVMRKPIYGGVSFRGYY